MKKILVVMVAIFVCAVNVNATEVAERSEISAEYAVNATLYDEDNGGSLFLYSDGTCVVRYTDGYRCSGTYDISNTTIYFVWDGNSRQQGYCRFVEGQLKSVSVEGFTFSRNVVVSRQR